MESLHKYISPDCLMRRYGGSLKCAVIDGKDLAELFEFYHAEFVVENSYGYTKWIGNMLWRWTYPVVFLYGFNSFFFLKCQFFPNFKLN